MAEGMRIRDFWARLLSFLNPNAMNAHPETALTAQPLTLSAAVDALTDNARKRLVAPKRGLSPNLIAVSLQGGLVAPTGFSDNQRAGQCAEENAYQTGATRVNARDLSGPCWSLG